MKLISSLISLLVISSVAVADFQYSYCKFTKNGPLDNVKILSNGSTTIFYFDITGANFNLANGTYGAAINTFGYNPLDDKDLGGVYGNSIDPTIGCSGINENFRLGDLGNIVIENGASKSNLTSTKAKLNGDVSIVGRSVVIYEAAYDCTTPDKTDLKKIVASCVIGIGGATGMPAGSPIALDGANTAAASTILSLAENDAMVVLKNTTKSSTTISGDVLFRSSTTSNVITITAQVNALTNASHGFHIHAVGNLGSEDGTALGGHWLATDQTHGFPDSTTRHFGDLGNICFFNADASVASYKLATNYITLPGLVGRGFAIHANRDNGTNYVGGDRVAQGVVALISKAPTGIVDVPAWNYEVVCANGGVDGSTVQPTTPNPTTPNPTTATPTPTPTATQDTDGSESNISSFVSPFIGLVLISLISTLFF